MPITTYSDGWERDDPITIASFTSGEACCPKLRRLPGGDLAIGELPNGELLIVYDVQNWIAEPGAPPRKAIRAVRMRRSCLRTCPGISIGSKATDHEEESI